MFECILERDLLDKMVARISEIIDKGDDSVRIYTLCANCESTIKVIGTGEVTKNKNVYII